MIDKKEANNSFFPKDAQKVATAYFIKNDVIKNSSVGQQILANFCKQLNYQELSKNGYPVANLLNILRL